MRLTKHHGLGNDFLVLLDLDDLHPVDHDTAVDVCDRTRGVGADGLIRVTRGGELPFRMELRNEDGGRAEMSGNGISCMAQALVLAGVVGTTRPISIETDAGPRHVQVVGRPDPRTHRMRVEMGAVHIGQAEPEWESQSVLRTLRIDVGNPHLVCHVADLGDAPDLVAFGRKVNEATPGGVNVELVAPGVAPGEVAMLVYERGVGPTSACGTGAVAAAAAAHHWSLAPATTTVVQPGGPVRVELGAVAHLSVPVVAVADVRWPWP